MLAAEPSGGPRIYAEDVTVTSGGSFYVTVKAEGLNALSAIDIYLYYSTDDFTLLSSSVKSLFSSETTTQNTSTPGEAYLGMISTGGVSGSGQVWQLQFRANSGAQLGKKDITIAVGDAYDSSLSPVNFSVRSPEVTVNKAQTTQNTVSIYSSSSYSGLTVGKEVTVSFYTNNAYGLSAADFEVEYDRDLLEFKSISFSSRLTSAQNAMFSTFSDVPGYVKTSYASTSSVTGSMYPMVSVTFKVLANVDATTDVMMKLSSVYDASGQPLGGSNSTAKLYLEETEVAPVLPKILIQDYKAIDGGFELAIVAPGESGIAAADLLIGFNSSVVECVSAQGRTQGCLVIANPDNENGTVKLSFIKEDGISEDTEIAYLRFMYVGDGVPSITISGKNAYNADFVKVDMDYGVEHVKTVATCTGTEHCLICGTVYSPALGHTASDVVVENEVAPDCVSDGSYDNVIYCTVCDAEISRETVVVPALGHDLTNHEAKEPTCLDIGWYAYDTCSRCDYTTYAEIPALGHRVLTGGIIWVDSITLTNDASYPFALQDGVYSSTNKRDSSVSYFTITAVYDCEINISYSVSSEYNYDKLIITKNNSQIVNVSGGVSWTSKTVSLSAGDVIKISYSKDGSVASGSDTAWFSFTCTQTEINDFVPGPAEDAEPTCTEAVVCHYCQTVVKEALGHDEIHHSAQAQTCTEIGWDAYDTCSRCDYTTYVEIPANGHTYGNWVETKASTCLTDGSERRDCHCGHFETREVAALGHDIVHHNAQAATCTEIGWDAYETCSRCDYTTYAEIPALGHNKVQHSAKDATCTEIGWNAYETCSRCDYSTYAEIPALGHNRVQHSAKDATCTDIGWNAYEACSRCDYTTYVELPALGHRVLVDDRILVDSITVTNDAKYPFALQDGIYSSTNHLNNTDSYLKITALYDCTLSLSYAVSSEKNYDKLIIKVNGSIIVEISGQVDWASKAIELNAGDIVTINYHKDVSVDRYEDTGWFSFTCTQTEVGEFVPGPAEDAEPTCTEAVVCHYCQTVVKEALGHSYGDWYVITAPTCTETGTDEHECTVCQYTETRTTNALGHTAAEAVVENRVEPTCTVNGSYDSVVYCAVCKAELTKEMVLVPATGHTESVAVVENLVLPNCTVNGSYDSVTYCSVCNTELSRVAQTIDKLGHHEVSHSAKSPTCTEIGWDSYVTCSRCDYTTYTEIPATGHTYGNWVETKASTCLTDGSERRDCHCGHFETREVAALGHGTVHHNAQAATCTAIGWDAYDTCSRCDYSTYVEIPANGHSYGTWEVILDPTCTALGTECRGCNNCEHYETRDVAALGHDEANHDAKAPTCTEIGWDAYVTCSRCDYTTYVEKTALGHDKIDHEAKTPTCTEIGWDAYATCSRCDYTTYTEIPATGHTYGNWVETKVPTCLTKGTERRDCHCGHFETREVAALGHDIVHHNAQAATCTAIGWDAYDTCSRCDYTTYAEIPATGHTASNWIVDVEATYEADGSKYKECTVCGETLETSIVPMLTHSYESIVTPPTCTEQGCTTHTCSDCGNSYVDDYVPAIGHSYGAWVQILAPTCEVVGTERRDCENCNHYETRNITATGHTEGDWIVDLNATCASGGSKHIECTVCEKTLETAQISPLGHNYSAEMTVDVEPTCTEGGSKSRHCTRCDYKSNVTAILPLGHGIVSHPAKSATCTDIGWDAYETCSRCDYTTYVEKTALGHEAGEAVKENEVAADCTKDGSYDSVVYCTRCGEELSRETVVVPATGHDYDAVVTDPACTTQGYTTYTCSCGDSYVDNYVDTLGHTKAEAVEENKVDSTCASEGKYDLVVYCSVCGEEISRESKTIAKKGHTAGEEVKENEVAGNCTVPTSYDTVVYCTVCGAEISRETVVVTATGHNYDAVVTAPTCTSKGYTTYTCTVCGNSYVDNYVDELDHTAGEAVKENEVAADCVNDGSYDNVVYCTVCNAQISRETVVVPATGHKAADAVVENNVDATCAVDGSYDNVVYCTVCDAEISRKAVVVSALGHTPGDAATCTEAQYCTVCGVELEGALKHNMDEGRILNAPTCTKDGSKLFSCQRCDYTYLEVLDKLGHTEKAPVEENRLDATCTAEGSYDKVVYCSVCNEVLSKENFAIPATGHAMGEWIQTVAPGNESVGEERRDCANCDHFETRELEALGYLREFIDAVNSLSENESTENTYSELSSAIQLYAKLTEEEKTAASDAFRVLQAAIEAYNAKVEIANGEMEKATEIALLPITAGFAFLAALWFLLKKKFWIK